MDKIIQSLNKYIRAANYLCVSQIYLQDNFLLDKPLEFDHIKPRLLGHWGTCPGINFVYAHLNRLIQQNDSDFIFVVGPGHGFPAVQANLFLENTLEKFYPKASHTSAGINYLSREFSWPYGFPSHSNPGTPGVILEGGELGYALSTSYGAALDNPDLIVACLIGDGEAETGPTATAWHLNKIFDPAGNGAVLPIVHVNGYKISGPTFYGRMSDEELRHLFEGYGYQPILVSYEGNVNKIHESMIYALDTSYRLIRELQEKARSGKNVERPKYPMIVLRTPKGWTGITELKNEKIEGNFLAHQVVGKEAKSDQVELKAIENWMRSYNFQELFDERGFDQQILDLIPKAEKRMGDSKHTKGGEPVYQPLNLPDPKTFSETVTERGIMGSSSMRRAGEFLKSVFELNETSKNFRLMSPDETYSNKLDEVFKTTARAFAWPQEPWDKDLSVTGRVMEMLSEHSLQGLTQGYVLSGRHAIFASYEAFIPIVGSMVDQYAKFLKVAREIEWRGDVPSLNFILTSSGWRQEHNGFSHQNPGFIDDILQRQGNFTTVYFPADGNSTLVALSKMLSSKNEINVLAAGKTQEPRWLTPEEAEEQINNGVGIWNFASDEQPDLVLSAVGDYMTKEMLATISLVKKEAPEIKIRFVNISSLSPLGIGSGEKVLSDADFANVFTPDKPVIFNFHGYPQTLKQILFDYYDVNPRFSVHGYVESGSTTTPFDMHVRNNTDRYNLAIEVFKTMARDGILDVKKSDELVKIYENKISEFKSFIIKKGVDPEEIELWKWSK